MTDSPPTPSYSSSFPAKDSKNGNMAHREVVFEALSQSRCARGVFEVGLTTPGGGSALHGV